MEISALTIKHDVCEETQKKESRNFTLFECEKGDMVPDMLREGDRTVIHTHTIPLIGVNGTNREKDVSYNGYIG